MSRNRARKNTNFWIGILAAGGFVAGMWVLIERSFDFYEQAADYSRPEVVTTVFSPKPVETLDDLVAEVEAIGREYTVGDESKFLRLDFSLEPYGFSHFGVVDETTGGEVNGLRANRGDPVGWEITLEDGSGTSDSFTLSQFNISLNDAVRDVEENDSEYGLNLEVTNVKMQRWTGDDVFYSDQKKNMRPIIEVEAEDGPLHYTAQFRHDGLRAPVWFEAGDTAAVFYRLDQLVEEMGLGGPFKPISVTGESPFRGTGDEEREWGNTSSFTADGFAGRKRLKITWEAGCFPRVSVRDVYYESDYAQAMLLKPADRKALQEQLPPVGEGFTWKLTVVENTPRLVVEERTK